MLLEHPEYVVISCSGGSDGAHQLKRALPAVADRVIGSTEELNGMPGQVRFLEIQRYLRSYATPNAVWFALDSKPQAYPEGTTELYAVDPELGVTHGFISRLTDAIRREEARKLAIHAELAAA
jgi:hypothetical protein